MSEFKCPKRLALFLMAIGEKLTGEQLRECINHSRESYTELSLNSWETGVAQWIMADDAMAEQYVQEHRKGLERLEEQRRKCQWAYERLTGRGWSNDYTISAELESIGRRVKDALEKVEEIRKAAQAPTE